GRTGRAGRLGTAITIVSPSDTKSLSSIEKLIGQTIPCADPAGGATPQPVEAIPAEAAPASGRTRKPPRESQRSTGGGRGRKAAPAPQPAPAQQPASIGRTPFAAQPRRAAASSSEPADHSHLPAFLLRPVPARG